MADDDGEWGRLAAAPIFDPNLEPAPLRILAALSCYVGKDGICWPAVGTLADRLSMSQRNVQKHIRVLEAAGYVTVDRQSKGYKGRVVNTYKLHYPRLPEPVRVNQEFTLYEAQGVNLDDTPFLSQGANTPTATGELQRHPTGELQVRQGVNSSDTLTIPLNLPNEPTQVTAHFPPRYRAPADDDHADDFRSDEDPTEDDYGFEGHDDDEAA